MSEDAPGDAPLSPEDRAERVRRQEAAVLNLIVSLFNAADRSVTVPALRRIANRAEGLIG